MAQSGNPARERRILAGTYRISARGEANKVVSIPSQFDGGSFPTEVGGEVQIEQVEDLESGEVRIELRPVEGE